MILGSVLKYAGVVIAVFGLICALELAAKGGVIEHKQMAYSAALFFAAGLSVCALGEIIRILHRIADAAERSANLNGAKLVQDSEK